MCFKISCKVDFFQLFSITLFNMMMPSLSAALVGQGTPELSFLP